MIISLTINFFIKSIIPVSIGSITRFAQSLSRHFFITGHNQTNIKPFIFAIYSYFFYLQPLLVCTVVIIRNMLGLGFYQNKIINLIIGFVAVFVMYNFFPFKLSSQVLFHNIPVIKKPFPIYNNSVISSSFIKCWSTIIMNPRNKLSFFVSDSFFHNNIIFEGK